MGKIVSVIVPIYNVEEYLHRCIDSITKQSYFDLEIILVDDGSPDNCGAVCDEYAKSDSRIKVIHKTNGGLSDARNAGLNVCTGEYILFVDSDDWIAEDTVQILMEQMADGVDMVAGSSVDVQEHDGTIRQVRFSIPLGTKTKLTSDEAMKDNLLHGWAAWNKLYRRTLFDTIRFPVGRINEDEAIMLHVLAQCGEIIQIGHPTYFYFLRQNSITTSSFSEKKMDWYINCCENLEYIREYYPALLPEAEYRLESALLYLLQFMMLEPKRFSNQIQQLHLYLRENYCTMWDNKYSGKKDKTRLFLFKMVLDLRLTRMYQVTYNLYKKLK